MDSNKRFVLINNVKLPVNASVSEAFSVAKGTLKRAGLLSFAEEYSVFRRSIDARCKHEICYVYSIAVTGDFPHIDAATEKRYGIVSHSPVSMDNPIIGDRPLSAPPVIVGSGPCGLFAALLLAEWGYAPVILERGGSVADRHSAQERFESTHVLDTDTNIQFGAGGAGTFSDGKLVTRINDPLTSYILERFIEFGAPEEIRYIAKPHIVTDVLSVVVDRMIERICSLGGKILYNTKYLSPVTSGGTSARL